MAFGMVDLQSIRAAANNQDDAPGEGHPATRPKAHLISYLANRYLETESFL